MKIIQTDKAPKAIGPYSQAIETDNMLFISGQIPVEPASNEIVKGGIKIQTKQVLENIKHILFAAGFTMENMVKTTCYLKNMDDFSSFNGIYREMLGDHKPARATIEVSRLPKDVLIEIDAIAIT